MFSLYPKWETELLQLVNVTQNQSFKDGDLVFTIDQVNSTPEAVRVNITAGNVSAYYGDAYIIYTKRDVSKAFLGIPLKVVVNANTLVKNILEGISIKYGMSFDTVVDVAVEELNKPIDFAGTGFANVRIPFSATSYVWQGELDVLVSNAALDLGQIVQNSVLTSLRYLAEDGKAAIALAIAPIDWTGVLPDDEVNMLEPGDSLSTAALDAIIAEIALHGVVPDLDVFRTALAGLTYKESQLVFDMSTFGYKYAVTFDGGDTPEWGGSATFLTTFVPDINEIYPEAFELDYSGILSNVYNTPYGPSPLAFAFIKTTEPQHVVRWFVFDAVAWHDRPMPDYTSKTYAHYTMLGGAFSKENIDITITDLPDGHAVTIVGKNGVLGRCTVTIKGDLTRTGAFELNYACFTEETMVPGEYASGIFNQIANIAMSQFPVEDLYFIFNAIFGTGGVTDPFGQIQIDVPRTVITKDERNWVLTNANYPGFSFTFGNASHPDTVKYDLGASLDSNIFLELNDIVGIDRNQKSMFMMMFYPSFSPLNNWEPSTFRYSPITAYLGDLLVLARNLELAKDSLPPISDGAAIAATIYSILGNTKAYYTVFSNDYYDPNGLYSRSNIDLNCYSDNRYLWGEASINITGISRKDNESMTDVAVSTEAYDAMFNRLSSVSSAREIQAIALAELVVEFFEDGYVSYQNAGDILTAAFKSFDFNAGPFYINMAAPVATQVDGKRAFSFPSGHRNRLRIVETA